MRARSYILHFAHSRKSFALFDDLVNSAIVTACDDRDARPAWIETATDRERLDVETASAEESDDAR
jgi:pyrroloquinoline quinone (PQQ) biosynthesis protein C